jgi:hypothetical protein
MAKTVWGWAIAFGVVVGVMPGCGGISSEKDATPDAATCSASEEGAARFDEASLPSDPIRCEADADCETVTLSSDCGNGCVNAIVNSAAVAAIANQLDGHPQQRCSACSALVKSAEVTFDPACSAAPSHPTCVGGQCRLYHPL